MTPTVIRASSLSTYHDCPRRAATRIFRREIEAAGFKLAQLPAGIGASIGTAVHKAASVMLDEKMKTGELPPLSVATDAAVETLREGAADGVVCDRETPTLHDGERQVIGMAYAYHRDIAPEIQPMQVEGRLEAEAAPGIVLSGQADVIAREPGVVRDLKSGKRRGNHKPQIGAYSLLARSAGIDITGACEDFVQRVSFKKPQPPGVTFRHDVAAAETAATNTLRRIEADIRTFREGDAERRILPGDPWAFPANPSSMLCSAKFCAAWNSDFCKEHAVKEEIE